MEKISIFYNKYVITIDLNNNVKTKKYNCKFVILNQKKDFKKMILNYFNNNLKYIVKIEK